MTKLKGKGGGKFKYMSEKDMLELAAKFSPYRYVFFSAAIEPLTAILIMNTRSLFMWYMWRIENVDVAVLGG